MSTVLTLKTSSFGDNQFPLQDQSLKVTQSLPPPASAQPGSSSHLDQEVPGLDPPRCS